MKSEDENSLSISDIRFYPPLYIQRYQKALDILEQYDILRVADFGCAEGKFVRRLKKLPQLEELVCVDCDDYSLQFCVDESRPLAWDMIFGRSKALTIDVLKGDLSQKECALKGFDAITCIELIEHMTEPVLKLLVENIFGFIRPKVVIISTPNAEFNVLFTGLNETSKLRHWDHKFEWTRQQFQEWCHSIAHKYDGYRFELTGVGEPPVDRQDIGFCTQIATFNKTETESGNEIYGKDYSCYRLLERFRIEKSNRKDINQNDEPMIDWSSVLN